MIDLVILGFFIVNKPEILKKKMVRRVFLNSASDFELKQQACAFGNIRHRIWIFFSVEVADIYL